MYHAIFLNTEFIDPHFPDQFTLFAKRKSQTNSWILIGVEIPSEKIESAIIDIQRNLKPNAPYYVHCYSDKELIIIFKERVFRVTPQQSSWNRVIDYGKSLQIPSEQLDFWPNRFQDEIHYFNKEDFI